MLVTDGAYQSIIKETEVNFNLTEGSIQYQTIKSRVLSKNPLDIIRHQNISPLYKIEPVLVDFCCKPSQIGEALIKSEVMELMDEMIRGTEHEVAYKEYCIKRKIEKDWSKGIVGERWYNNRLK